MSAGLSFPALLLALMAGFTTASWSVASGYEGPTESAPQAPVEDTGLSVSIDDIAPAAISPETTLRLSGTVANDSHVSWRDAQVYLTISFDPAASKSSLDAIDLGRGEEFGTRVVELGLFDEIGKVIPGESKDYRLKIPPGQLPISRASGVYHAGVIVVASTGGDDRQTAAITDTFLPYLDAATTRPRASRVVTLLPVTAAIVRQPNGTFTDDRLGAAVSSGGRLRHLLDFALQAPRGSLTLLIDPALQQALQDMSDGYAVQSLPAVAAGEKASTGAAQGQAAAWLADLADIAGRQNTALLPWGGPATSALAEAELPGVVEAGVRAAQRYALSQDYRGDIIDWQYDGSSSRRGVAVAQKSGATTHIVSNRSLSGLRFVDDTGYPPPEVSLATQQGPLPAIVTGDELAGAPFDASLNALAFRQSVMAESLVRALTTQTTSTMVVAAPFDWDPGDAASGTDVATGYAFPTIRTIGLDDILKRPPLRYAGPVQPVRHEPELATGLVEATKRLRDSGRVLSDLLTDSPQTAATFEQRLALAGSAAWQRQPRRGEALVRRAARETIERVGQVTVTGPTFVALSSSSGSFPLTVTNGLDVTVDVQIEVKPLDPALEIDPIDPIRLAAGQRRDVEVVTHSNGSGLTQVQAGLSTMSDRSFGKAWKFDIRATQIGVAIWVVMVILLAALFSTAAVRIVKRVRAHDFHPRGETSL